MYTIFLARFVGEGPAFKSFPANFSTSKKVSAFQSCLRTLGFRPVTIVTHTGVISATKRKVQKIGDSICIIPGVVSLTQNRKLQYIIGIFCSALVLFRLTRLRRINYFFVWDFLPDTLLPLTLLGSTILKRTIVDVEEAISRDPQAHIFFKKFERFAVKIRRWRTIGNNISTAKTLGLDFQGIFPGFYATSLAEERKLFERVVNKTYENSIIVLFSGRIDSVRGSTQFVELARLFEKREDIRFIVTGYGKEGDIVDLKRKSPINVVFQLGLERNEYLDLLFKADIAFNYLSDLTFSTNSFPSKVVEYLLGSVVVISNHVVDIRTERLIIRENLRSIADFVSDYSHDKQLWRRLYRPDLILEELSPYSILSGARNLKRIMSNE